MTELADYYRELILDHSRNPRNRGTLAQATHYGKSLHPAKGDCFEVYLQIENEQIKAITFEGSGSAIALASASLMTRYAKGKTVPEAFKLAQAMRTMMLARPEELTQDFSPLEDLAALAGVRQFPARVACALLAWEALENALN